MGMAESVPWKRPPIYSRVGVLPAERGFGPSRLAFEDAPLPLVTYRVWPSRATRTEVGYQPVGMNPSGALEPTALTFTTARQFVLALATNRTDSSGVSASELGVLPEGARGSIAVPIVST